MVKECRDLANVWNEGTDEQVEHIDAKQFNRMTSMQQVKVLDCIEAVGIHQVFMKTI